MRHGLAAAVLLLAACGGGDDDTAAPTTTTATPVPSSTATTAAGDDEGIGEVEAVLPSLLVGAAELGLTDAGFTPEDGSPCGEPVATAGARLESPTGAVVEVLRVYGDVEAAAACMPSEGDDVAAEVGAEEAVRSGPSFTARVADVVASFEVTVTELDAVEVVAFGVGKISGYLETAPGG